MSTPSFENDIMPLFKQYQARMMWRFDLTDYETVKANAESIYAQIQIQPDGTAGMPPPPFSPLKQEQVDAFKQWMDNGYPK